MAVGHRPTTLLLGALIALAGCDTTKTVPIPDIDAGGIECDRGQIPRLGKCICQNDLGCQANEFCEGVTGTCKPRVVIPPDAGLPGCTSGARRCAPVANTPDGGKSPGAVQECRSGQWVDAEACPPEGYCTASATGFFCAVCNNGQSRCKEGDDITEETCSEKGDLWIAATCPPDPVTKLPSKCIKAEGRCQTCTPDTHRCSPDGRSLETCSADGKGWTGIFCATTGKCLVGQAPESDAGTPDQPYCVPPVCTPAEKRCKAGSTTNIEICRPDGTGFDESDCRTFDAYATANAICQDKDCYDLCGNAARTKSYLGCEYWAAVTSNSQLDAAFKGGASDGQQPTKTSEFAIVVSNLNDAPANVRVTRNAGGEKAAPSDPAADANGNIVVAAKSLVTIKLPWQSVKGTGKNPYAYRLTSTLPISAYQFNPVGAYTGNSANIDATGFCTNCSYTNDASLLLPAHILANQYVVIAQEHVTIETISGNSELPAFFSVVGTQDNTQVTIRFSATTAAGGGIAAQGINSTKTYTLNKYDVLQFITTAGGTKTATDCSSSSSPCYDYSGILSAGFTFMDKWQSDPTGSVVKADKPVAVFGGADCSLKPYTKMACDHIEEMMLPFNTWGHSYAGVKSAAYCTNTTTAICSSPVSKPSPDFYRVIGGCGKADCPAGTTFVINPAPDQIIDPNKYCTGAKCTLPPTDTAGTVATAAWIEFSHSKDFTVISQDQPIMVAQYLTSEDASSTKSSKAAEGDPSLMLLPPVEQWRMTYNILTAPGFKHNYLALVSQSAGGVQIDGKDLTPANFPSLQTSLIPGGYVVYRVPVSGGAHSVISTSKVGVTIYGYDAYVSYGYTGGLDLLNITIINPGG